MDKNAYKIRCEQWLRVVTECNKRDQSISKKQWCMMNGVDIKSFYYWQNKFRNELLIHSSTTVTQAPAFVDITAQVRRPTIMPEEVISAEKILAPELMIQAGDIRVYVSESVHEQTLAKVMKVLRNA